MPEPYPSFQLSDFDFGAGGQPSLSRIEARLLHIRKAERAGITKAVSWHIFRHTFSSLLVGNGENVKTAQSLMRHANANITMGIYTHAITSDKRQAQTKVVEMVLPQDSNWR